MSEPVANKSSSVPLLSVAYASTVLMAGVLASDVYDIARGNSTNSTKVFFDVATTVITGITAWNNVSVAQSGGSPTQASVIITNVADDIALLINGMFNDLGGAGRQSIRALSLPVNIIGTILIFNEDKFIA
jgi:hypothetical protein